MGGEVEECGLERRENEDVPQDTCAYRTPQGTSRFDPRQPQTPVSRSIPAHKSSIPNLAKPIVFCGVKYAEEVPGTLRVCSGVEEVQRQELCLRAVQGGERDAMRTYFLATYGSAL